MAADQPKKSMEEYRKEFVKIEEGFRSELSRCNKLALQISSSFGDATGNFASLRVQHEDISRRISDYIAKVWLLVFLCDPIQ